jgi:hypothetical protein
MEVRLVVLAVVVVQIIAFLVLEEQETPHQHHHHKEVMAAPVKDLGLHLLEVEVVVLVALVETLQVQLQEVLVETEQHLLFLEHR